jgi:hypothetical protein
MMVTGTLIGAYARRWPMYMYRLPKPPPPLTLRNADPNRLDPLHEYPRDKAFYTPHMHELVTDDLVDYRIGVEGRTSYGADIVRVYLRANRYCAMVGTPDKLIAEYHCSPVGDFHMMFDEMLKEAVGGIKSMLIKEIK